MFKLFLDVRFMLLENKKKLNEDICSYFDLQLSSMHLTGLCNTCTDNPTKVSKFELVSSILNFLDTDTVLYFAPVNLF